MIVDGLEYEEYTYSIGAELEKSIKYHVKDIFGENSIFFEKKRLKSLAGLGSIPDGFVVDFRNKAFHIIEIELSTHDVYRHILNQLSKFITGMRNPVTHKKIVSAIDDELKKEEKLREEVKEAVGGEIYRFLSNLIPEQDPSIIVVIDKKTDELNEACQSLSIKVSVVEFSTFVLNVV